MIHTNEAWKKIAVDPYHRTSFSLLVDGKEVPGVPDCAGA